MEVILIVETADSGLSEKQKKLAIIKQLAIEVIELNKTDPKPLEFDASLSQRIEFKEGAI